MDESCSRLKGDSYRHIYLLRWGVGSWRHERKKYLLNHSYIATYPPTQERKCFCQRIRIEIHTYLLSSIQKSYPSLNPQFKHHLPVKCVWFPASHNALYWDLPAPCLCYCNHHIFTVLLMSKLQGLGGRCGSDSPLSYFTPAPPLPPGPGQDRMKAG